MTKFIFLSFIFIHVSCFSQIDGVLSITNLESFVEKQGDSLFQIRNQLEDGKYTIYFDERDSIIARIFYVKNGKITDLYREYNYEGHLTIGYYKDDSLWTFRYPKLIDENNTFKRGTWKYLIGFQIKGPTENYPMDFDKDSIFEEKWLYQNDQTWILRKFHRRIGKIHESIYYKNGNLSYEYRKYPNSSLIQEFDTLGNLTNLKLMEEIGFEIELNKSNRFFPKEGTKFIRFCKGFDHESFNHEFDNTIVFDKNNRLIHVLSNDKSIKRIKN